MNSRLGMLIAIIIMLVMVLSGILFAIANDENENEKIAGIYSTVITSANLPKNTATSLTSGGTSGGSGGSQPGGSSATQMAAALTLTARAIGLPDNITGTQEASETPQQVFTATNKPFATNTAEIPGMATNQPNQPAMTATTFVALSPTVTKTIAPNKTATIFFSATPTNTLVPSATKTKHIELPTSTKVITLTPTKKPATATATQARTSTPRPTALTRCDPSYPTVCIPPPPPDLDCKDIPYRNFAALQPDPHKFDPNKNGIGCEQIKKPEDEQKR